MRSRRVGVPGWRAGGGGKSGPWIEDRSNERGVVRKACCVILGARFLPTAAAEFQLDAKQLLEQRRL